jgi:hypothetical protein
MAHCDCFGGLFPSINGPKTDVPVRGKAFSVELERAGGFCIAARKTAVNVRAWDNCLACKEFEDCDKLSLAKLALETGVMQNTT